VNSAWPVPNGMAEPLIVFDLDGTLVDTAPDLIGTLNVILSREGLAPLSMAEARPLIGAGVRPLLERGLGKRQVGGEEGLLDRLFADFLEHYAAHIAERSRPFPGVEEMLDQLSARGFLLAVCTNKLEWLSVRLLEALKLGSKFRVICGQDTFGLKKPDAEFLRRTIRAAGGAENRTIMVGDSETDIRLARNAGVPAIAVDFGYTETPVARFEPDATISHFDQLPAALARLAKP
jgi:phosphoglycolate phosphatase